MKNRLVVIVQPLALFFAPGWVHAEIFGRIRSPAGWQFLCCSANSPVGLLQAGFPKAVLIPHGILSPLETHRQEKLSPSHKATARSTNKTQGKGREGGK